MSRAPSHFGWHAACVLSGRMPYKRIATRLLLGAALTCLSSANAITIDYSSTVNSSIHFDGANHFDFLPAANSFHVDSGTAAGLLGDMAGSYSIPPVSLASLKTSAHDASFSGSISDVPDSGLSLSLLGFALMGIEGLRRKLRK